MVRLFREVMFMTTTIRTFITSLSNRLLRWADINVHMFRALVHAYLLMDFRNQHFGRATATGPTELVTPLFWVVGQYLLVGGILSALLFARVDAFFFALVTLGTTMMVMATAIIVEFNEVVLDLGDLAVIGHQPVPARTYAAARLTNLLVYVLLVTASLTVFPAIVGVGLRDSSWLFLPAYVVVALLGNLSVTGIVILLYTTLLSRWQGDAVKNVLAWTQVILIMILVYGGQAVLRDAKDTLEMMAYHLPQWIMLLPPAWLASFVDGCAAGQPGTFFWILGGGILVVAGLWMAVTWRLSLAYAQMQPGSATWQRMTLPPLPQPGTLAGPITRLLTRSREETVAFWLCSTMLKRDHDLKMRSWPALGVVIGLLLLGVFSAQLGDPFMQPGAASVLSIACLYVLAVPIPTIMNNLHFSQDHAASWVLWSAPVADRLAFAEGMRKAVMYRILFPLWVGLLVVFGAMWHDVTHVLVHLTIGWLVIVGAGYAAQMGVVRTFPFSEPLVRGATMGPIALWAGIVNGAAAFLAVIHYYAVRLTPGFVVYCVGLVLLILILRRMSQRTIIQRFAKGHSYA